MQNKLETLNSEEITPQAALIFVDNALYRAEGRRLNDLESRIFLGSWEGKTYEEIHPSSPEYVEKSVGYKLWKKLSIALGEKVSKKRIRSAVMRHCRSIETHSSPAQCRAEKTKYVTIWHQSALDDPLLMQTLRNGLENLGYRVQSSISERKLAEVSLSPPSSPAWSGVQYDDALVITFSVGQTATAAAASIGN